MEMNDMQNNDNSVRDTLQRPVRDLRISVIDACNFRCSYCMPIEKYPDYYEFMRKGDRLSFEEITRIARQFVALGAVKIRLTGGEPLLRKNLPELICQLREIEGLEDLNLTTNGYWLAEHASALRQAGLDRLNLSLDSLDDAVFRRITGRSKGGVERILDGLRAAHEAGFEPIKVNVVVQRGVNDEGLLDMVEFFRNTGHILRFIEYMDVGNLNEWEQDEVVPYQEIVDRIAQVHPIEAVPPNYAGEVARRFRLADGSAELGFVSSVSKPFCGDCHRARLSADGKLYTCLFASKGHDLRQLLQDGATDDELHTAIAGIWQARDDRYSELRAKHRADTDADPKVEMFAIGG